MALPMALAVWVASFGVTLVVDPPRLSRDFATFFRLEQNVGFFAGAAAFAAMLDIPGEITRLAAAATTTRFVNVRIIAVPPRLCLSAISLGIHGAVNCC